MTDFQNRLEEAENAEPLPQQRDPEILYWWEAGLKEFVSYINRKHVGRIWAFLEGSMVSDTLRLRLAPFARKNEATTALVVHGAGMRATALLAQRHVVFKSRQELDDFLVDFLRLPAFRETLEVLANRNNEPCEGYLRFGADPEDRDSARDIMVLVPSDIQRRIAESVLGHQRIELPNFDVELLKPNVGARGTLNMSQPPKWLYSGGFFVELTAMTRSTVQGQVCLRGKPYLDAEHELNAA